MVDNKLAQEEAQRAANYEALKSGIKSDVSSDIAARAEATAISENRQTERIAENFRDQAVNEIVDTDREVQRSRFLARISQVIDYIFFILYGFLTIRLFLTLLGANPSAGFVKFINSVTNPLYEPFRGILSNSPTADNFTRALQILIAIVVYLLVHLGINGLLRIFAHRKTEI